MEEANQAEGHATLAMALLDEGRIDEAIEHFQKSLEIEPQSARTTSVSASLLALARADGRGHRAFAKRPLSLDPDHAAAHSNLGVALDRKGKKDEALEHSSRAVQIDPGYVEGLRNLGKALLDRQKYDEAVACFRKAIAIKPGSAEMRFDLGLAIEAAGEDRRGPGGISPGPARWPRRRKTAALVEKIKAEIRRCEAWPWDEEK